MTLTNIHLWTVEDYHRMIEAAILTTDDRVELLEGQIIEKSFQNAPHAATIQRASDYLRSLLSGRATIRVQLPITLPPNSEPEPDIALVRVDSRDYFEGHPRAKDIFLVIEIADTTLRVDPRKALIYARAKIPEYWILDLNNQQVYRYCNPAENNYQQETILVGDISVSLVIFPQVKIQVSSLFP
ncbi:protein of unknown function DUF820 [Gloeothece citriformis PCC 7424]|uniref:Putative restriction endonuclease domain-containing protein n=1 Tax=Gloeothece citriformis (strain PCC 7424) TaxID=65393 RepID=B7K859_GLOC7|nr:Uma2 family endonuclease [Gloeothece citriformis]ACK68547.1 protein of unknown function DUF820 [Gloeothece citriformis PCC 7424]